MAETEGFETERVPPTDSTLLSGAETGAAIASDPREAPVSEIEKGPGVKSEIEMIALEVAEGLIVHYNPLTSNPPNPFQRRKVEG